MDQFEELEERNDNRKNKYTYIVTKLLFFSLLKCLAKYIKFLCILFTTIGLKLPDIWLSSSWTRIGLITNNLQQIIWSSFDWSSFSAPAISLTETSDRSSYESRQYIAILTKNLAIHNMGEYFIMVYIAKASKVTVCSTFWRDTTVDSHMLPWFLKFYFLSISIKEPRWYLGVTDRPSKF